MKKVLFVCHGNICRSPIAEYVFKYKTKGMDCCCESRALSNEEIGNDIYPGSKRYWISIIFLTIDIMLRG